MTFYEAALRVLEAAGQPLSSVEITEKSIAQGLLSHVGKTPEQTMLSRLAAMARRARDRRVTVTATDTFALVDWGLPEDANALEAMSAPYEHPEEGLPPLRPGRAPPRAAQRERPRRRPAGARAPASSRARRSGARSAATRRSPRSRSSCSARPTPPLAPSEVLRLARERQLASTSSSPRRCSPPSPRRTSAASTPGRRPNFALDPTGALMLEHDDLPVAEVQAAFAGRSTFRSPTGASLFASARRPARRRRSPTTGWSTPPRARSRRRGGRPRAPSARTSPRSIREPSRRRA